jgi:Na+/H+-dicarboxylate symporter
MAAETKEWKFLGMNMWQQVLLGFALGIASGFALGEDAAPLAILGTVFIKLIKMVVSPLIFCALIAGITSLTGGRSFKGLAVRGTVMYLSTALFAVCLGLAFGHFFTPGVGVAPPAVGGGTATATPPLAVGDFLITLIPGNIIHAMADDMYLQIVIFAIFTGIVMNYLAEETRAVREINRQLASIIFKMIEWIVRLAPLAVFGFIGSMVGTTGLDVIVSLLRLVVIVIAACTLQYLLFGVMIAVFGGISPLPFYRKMITTQVMAFSTSSSKATLTTAMGELQNKMGVSSSTSQFIMPLGACINMDGTAIYLGICAMFFSQMYGVELGGADYLMLVLTCTLGSIGAAGIPSGSIIFMGMVLASVGIPIEGIAIILGVDRILDMFRTTVNITGDAAVTLIMDKKENQLDIDQYYAKSKST